MTSKYDIFNSLIDNPNNESNNETNNEIDTDKMETVDIDKQIDDNERTETSVEQNTKIEKIIHYESFITNDLFQNDLIIAKENNSISLNDDIIDNSNSNPCKKVLITSKDKNTFNIYMNSTTVIQSPEYINKFCRFLNTLTEHQTVRLYLGSWVNDLACIEIGSLIESILNCKAKVVTIAGGCCGYTESYIWLFGDERIYGKYSMLTYGTNDILKYRPEYKHYIEFFTEKAKMLKILSDDEVENILLSNRTIYLFGNEIDKRINSIDE